MQDAGLSAFLARNKSKELSSEEDVAELYRVSGFREPEVSLLNTSQKVQHCKYPNLHFLIMCRDVGLQA